MWLGTEREHLLSKTPVFHSFLGAFPIHITPDPVPILKSICLTHQVNNTSEGQTTRADNG